MNTVAHLHFWAAIQNCFPAQEYPFDPHPLRDEWPLFPNLPRPINGMLQVPDGPGLGLELDEDVLQRLEQQP